MVDKRETKKILDDELRKFGLKGYDELRKLAGTGYVAKYEVSSGDEDLQVRIEPQLEKDESFVLLGAVDCKATRRFGLLSSSITSLLHVERPHGE